MTRAMLDWSWYSDMSRRTIASSLPKYSAASALESSVLPTPVGPRNKKFAIGRFPSRSSARARRNACDTAVTASSWPMTRACSFSSSDNSFCVSVCEIVSTGIAVLSCTTLATSSAVTYVRSPLDLRARTAASRMTFSAFSGAAMSCR